MVMNPVILAVCDTIESDINNYEALDLENKYFQLLKTSIQGLCDFLCIQWNQLKNELTDYVTIEASALGREGYGHAVRDANDLGFTGIQCHSIDLGGSSVACAIGEAERIARYNPHAVVLVASADIPKSAFRQVSDLKRLTKTVAHPIYEIPYGATLIAMYALLAKKQMHESSLTTEDYEGITQFFRSCAIENPRAFNFHKELTDKALKKYLAPPYSSPMVAIVTDHGFATLILGAIAYKNWLQKSILKPQKEPIYIVGSGHCVHAEYFTMKGKLESPAAIACNLAFQGLPLSRKDLEYAWIYDCFTGMIVSQASMYTGEEPKKVVKCLKDGFIPIEDKQIPINRGGGILNYQAAMSLSGATGLVDVLSQYGLSKYPIPQNLTNTPKVPKLSLLGNNGGIDSINSVVLFSTENVKKDPTLINQPNTRRIQLNPIQELYHLIKEEGSLPGKLIVSTTVYFNPGGDKKPPYTLALVECKHPLIDDGFVMVNILNNQGQELKDDSNLTPGTPITVTWKNGLLHGILD